MKRSIVSAALAAALAAAVAAPAAQAAPDRTVSVSLANNVATYEGDAALGFNVSYFDETAQPASCGKAPQNFCDSTLVFVDDSYTGSKKMDIVMDGFEISDYDLRVYKSDANGNPLAFEGYPTGHGTSPAGTLLPTFLGDPETKNLLGVKAGSYYLVDLVYFSTVPAETPNVKVTLK